MKVKYKDKVYEYQYKMILVEKNLHQKLKLMSIEKGMTMSNIINHLMETNENTSH
jgi:hypothetical protein